MKARMLVLVLVCLILFTASGAGATGPDMTCGLTLWFFVYPTTFTAVGQRLDYTLEIWNDTNDTIQGPFFVYSDRAAMTCRWEKDSLIPNDFIICDGTYYTTVKDFQNRQVRNSAWVSTYWCWDDAWWVVSVWEWPVKVRLPLVWR